MNFLHPMALAWSAVALPIVVLYLLKIRRRRQTVPTLMFWDQIFEETAPRSLWRRLRHWLSLLMQLAFLLLLVLALANPVPRGARHRPTHWVILLDQSASMRATDVPPTRFAAAQANAHRVIRAMRQQDQATVIGAGARITIACGRTHHQPTLHAAVDALKPTGAPGDLRKALALAMAIDVGQQERSVVVITDQPGAAAIDGHADASVIVYRCGRDTANVAITGFRVRPRADNRIELQGMLRVANWSREPVSAEVRLTLDGELFDAVWFKLAAGEEKLHTFQRLHTGGRVLGAALAVDDAFAPDNTAFAVLPEIGTKKIVLVSRGNLFLESALASHPWTKVVRVDPDAWPTADGDLVVFDGVVPADLPDIPSLFLYPSADSPLWTMGADLNNPLVSDIDDKAPLVRHVHLRNCTFHRARAITIHGNAKTLVASFEHPLLAQWSADGPPRVLLAVDIRQSDLPWRTAFPILMHNVIRALAGQGEAFVSGHATGSTVRLPAGSGPASAHDQLGRNVPVVVQDGQAVVGPVEQVGMVTVDRNGKKTDLAFNLASGEESNIRAGAADASKANRAEPVTASAWSWPWWVLLVIGAIGWTTTEWAFYQRRRIE